MQEYKKTAEENTEAVAEATEQQPTVEQNVAVEQHAVQTTENKTGHDNQVVAEDEAMQETKRIEEHNREQARLRRQREREEAIKKAKMEAVFETLNYTNPYTNEELKDEADYEQYLTMKRISDAGDDPIRDYYKYAKNRAVEQKVEVQERQMNEQKVQKDVSDFIAKYPNVNLTELVNDEGFNVFASGKLENSSLVSVYEDYQKLLKSLERQTVNKVAQNIANKKAGVGSLHDTQVNPQEGKYTLEQLHNMSKEEVEKNWDKILASLE